MNVEAYTPIAIAKVLKNVPLDINMKDTITFSSAEAQINYFNSKVKKNYTDLTPIRIQNAIELPDVADFFFDCNYLVFKNLNFSDKWFFAFITKVEYVNPNNTRIYFSIDPYQSWMFDLEIRPSFVEREHVSNDALYNNTMPENVDIGEHIITKTKYVQNDLNFSGTVNIYVGATSLPYSQGEGEVILNPLPTGVVVHNPGFFGGSLNGLYFLEVGNVILLTQEEIQGRLNGIMDCYVKSDVSTTEAISMVFLSFGFTDSKFANKYEFNPISNDFYNYTPVNNKLYCYPYSYLEIVCPSGSLTIKYENIKSNTHFYYSYVFGPNACMGVWVDNYSESSAFENFISVHPLPMGSWTFDAFAQWVNLKGMSAVLGLASQTLGIGGSIISQSPLGVANGAIGVGDSVNSLIQASKQPNKLVGSASNPDFWYSVTNIGWGPKMNRKQIKTEYAKSIDLYFTMYGYAVNTVKIPNINTRQSYNYVKTRDAKIFGSLPSEDLIAIRNMFNNGVTFWHGDYVGNYSVQNEVI